MSASVELPEVICRLKRLIKDVEFEAAAPGSNAEELVRLFAAIAKEGLNGFVEATTELIGAGRRT